MLRSSVNYLRARYLERRMLHDFLLKGVKERGVIGAAPSSRQITDEFVRFGGGGGC